MVFDPYFFVAKKPSPVTRTCTTVDFHNVHSVLGLFVSLVFNQSQVTGVGLWSKNSFFSKILGKIEDFS